MKKDNLKKFISENKEQFENEMPSDKLWSKIEKEIKPKQKKYWMLPAIVASVCLVLLSVFVFNSRTEIEQPTEIVSHQEIEENTVSSELMEVEEYYTIQVDLKIDEAEKFDESKDLLKEVELLKEEFTVLKKEMGEGANSNELLEAMIQNYKLRLGLLENLLEELKDEKPADKHENNI